MTQYIGIIHKEKKSDFGVSFPDFPGCITAGRTLEEARIMAEEALNFHIEGCIEDGEALPSPSSLDDIVKSPYYGDGVVILVNANIPSRKNRINVTIDANLLGRIDRHTNNRSAFFELAAKQALDSNSHVH